jgi:DNA-binding response OmpR family regulator
MPDLPVETVLVVDDDASVRLAVERVLARAGFRVVTAGGTRAAIAATRRCAGAVRAALVDLDLGDEDGLALVRHLLRRRPAIGIVVFSAQVDRDTRASLLALGVRAIVAKPAPPQPLVAAVRAAVGR